MLGLIQIIQVLFQIYFIMLVVRIIGSWFPDLQYTKFMRFVGHYTDPYLNFFRRFIPPLGGILDISPILAFFCLYILRSLVIRCLFFLYSL